MKTYTNKTDRVDERKCLYSEIKKGDKARKTAKRKEGKDEIKKYETMENIKTDPRHSDMISEMYVYKNEFRFQRMQKDCRWYVTYNNFIIAHGQYRHDLEEWIECNLLFIRINYIS